MPRGLVHPGRGDDVAHEVAGPGARPCPAGDRHGRAHHVRRVVHAGRGGADRHRTPHAGEPKIRAVAGLWDQQAVAVLANDPKHCGVWALGLARGLSEEASTQIRQEVADGVKDFGVTASPVPREP